MRRKIVKQGAATMMVSLPSKWVKENKLEKGDELEILEKGKDLLLTTKESVKNKREITIKLTEDSKKNIRNLLTHIYRRGFDKIIFTNADAPSFKEIKKSCSLLLGFEVTERKKDSCILENISEPSDDKYDIMLRKVFLNIHEQFDLMIEDFKSGRYDGWEEILDSRDNVDKFIIFCRRILFKKNQEDIVLNWEFLTFLMHIDHACFYLYKYAYDNKLKTDEDIINLCGDLVDYFKLLEDAFYKKDLNYIHKLHNLKEKFQFGKIIKEIEKCRSKESVLYSHIREIFRWIQLGTSPLYGLIFESKNNNP